MSSPYSPPETTALDAAPVVRPRPLVAVLLAIFTFGAGYYYAGARWRMVALAALYPALLAALTFAIHAGLPVWMLAPCFLAGPALWLDTYRHARRPDARRPSWPELAGVIVVSFLYFDGLSLLYRGFVIAPFYVPAGSMAPALLAGDYYLSDNFAYLVAEPVRGDIATFRSPDDPSVLFVKRIVGMPGDAVTLTAEGDVEINGTSLPLQSAGSYAYGGETFKRFREENPPDRSHFVLRIDGMEYRRERRSWQVPQGAYFLLGDNRDNSKDSRRWNRSFVPREDMVGRAIYIHWSRDPESGELRLARTGRLSRRVDLPAETPAAAGP